MCPFSLDGIRLRGGYTAHFYSPGRFHKSDFLKLKSRLETTFCISINYNRIIKAGFVCSIEWAIYFVSSSASSATGFLSACIDPVFTNSSSL